MSIASKTEIISGITDTFQSVNQYFDSIDDTIFYEPLGIKWSPAEHLHHLYVSGKAMVEGLKVPKLALYAFGIGGTSRTFDEIVAAYNKSLEKGAKASGKFVPTKTKDKFDKSTLLGKWNSLEAKFAKQLESWDEKQLDKYRMPHPILGKLTVREMLFFTIYHTTHHKESLEQQLSNATTETEDCM